MERPEILGLLAQSRRDEEGEESEESLRDLEKMYDIIIEARSEGDSEHGEFDERLALAALCKLNWPGKPPAYWESVKLVREKFEGISKDSGLAILFRSGLSTRLTKAKTHGDIKFNSLGDFYAGNLPRKKRRPSKLKSRS